MIKRDVIETTSDVKLAAMDIGGMAKDVGGMAKNVVALFSSIAVAAWSLLGTAFFWRMGRKGIGKSRGWAQSGKSENKAPEKGGVGLRGAIMIEYNEVEKTFSIHTKTATYQMAVDEYGNLLHLHFGGHITGGADSILYHGERSFVTNPACVGRDRTYTMEALPLEFPTVGNGDFRNSALKVADANGTVCARLKYTGHEIVDGGCVLRGLPYIRKADEVLTIHMADEAIGLAVDLQYSVVEGCDAVSRSAVIRNKNSESAGRTLFVKKCTPGALDFVYGDFDVITFNGRHVFERQVTRQHVEQSRISVGSTKGESSHQSNPTAILCERTASENYGSCWGAAVIYSGDFSIAAEKDQFGGTRFLAGPFGEDFCWALKGGESIQVPQVALSYSNSGFNGLSGNFHELVRAHVVNPAWSNKSRPVLLNSWEACYMHLDCDKLEKLGRDAASLGLDLLVMDDGWFGHRDDDNTSLGDWATNEKKLGCSLADLIKKITSIKIERGNGASQEGDNLKFGIWVEPEAVSEDSDLYRAHPDWAFGINGRDKIRGRYQLMLNFGREEVQQYIIGELCKILDAGEISYLKWDLNRSFTDVPNGESLHRHMLGVYFVLQTITDKYPDLLIEGCSGGGGRFDYGMLFYTPQIWCSDNTDAIDRAFIQQGSSYFYPPSVIASHVSMVPNHQTGRSTHIKTRGAVAMGGLLGYELRLGDLTAAEKDEVRKQVLQYKATEALTLGGKYYRLAVASDEAAGDFSAWELVSKDKTRAVVSAVMTTTHAGMYARYVKLRGLEFDAVYSVEFGDAKVLRITGGVLMRAGLQLPVFGDACAWRVFVQMAVPPKNSAA